MRARTPTQRVKVEARSAGEHSRMSVTLDVSKLGAWLNALAFCRVERRACDAGRSAARGGGRALGGGDASRMNEEGPSQGCGGHCLFSFTMVGPALRPVFLN